jgi:sulfatase maturation enzyme AslB (radical SAM superfamily)
VFQGFTRIENRASFLISEAGPRKKCKQCEFRGVCGGGCPAINYVSTGSVYEPDDLSCHVVFINERVHAYMRRRTTEVFGERVEDGEHDSGRLGPDENLCAV